ncbi:major tail protein [Acetobacterium sp. KB-1]|jgi:phi13 family phage major tail protein|uniref:major tail protein n=1 Tax=Acetobacterium sp. KB-1 TaxID=2184575 RepID=UPI000DBEC9DB|nr:major tail protein [Acetobacterium sp. KB-1]AWW25948.1 phage tail protein [Acetobacterium sp. KB-1]WKY49063.1 phage tail protein [Eubacteriaceae bacterium ES3]
MAQIGLKYLICSKLTETESAATYSDGRVMAYAIKAEMNIEINEGVLRGDDRIIENIKEFKSGKLTLNGDHLDYETRALILGHTLSTIDSTTNKQLTSKGSDDGSFVGVGFYATSIKNNVRGFRAIWLTKVKFGVPSESMETRGESINFQTPTIEGTISTNVLDVWKEEATFPTEAEAKTWLDTMASIGGTEG